MTLPLEPKKDLEIFKINLTARRIMELGSIMRGRAGEKFNNPDLKALGLGLPDKFLMIDGPQPTLAQLTVLANKLKMQIVLTHLEVRTLEEIEAENAAAAAAAK